MRPPKPWETWRDLLGDVAGAVSLFLSGWLLIVAAGILY